MKYEILKLIGDDCMTVEDGEKLYDLIHPKLVAGHPVELDFTGVEFCMPLFLNFGIARLLEHIPLEDLDNLVKVSNLDDLGMKALKIAIEHGHRYYTDEQYRQTIEDIETRRSQEWGQ